ncbi:coproporphyrinogen III oxidase [Arthrobacter sp. TES]|uniref:Heme chaperone HemW n=1 Tax=Paenarthrobacter ureafaciens TaxID=37931 RepID=A0AAX3ECN3_PAEUR|nr:MULTISPECIES: radical SAM family heme chaperone HemW [Paenarthrobacter]AOY71270.1 coproporphyrinogen III oxidase [Arthrobacter sp. ZXY-2]ERI39575.1 coproporphyrinogen III oxidase [Arthrobacter sp. AK-YN10]NKR10785.1 coproporphyrinogen III oxidase [Arthrobacter sp. M5]NKR18379.1 coproporphyrinogen III oxidase [Arthrobacter sp. M6]OEH57035.1 coproporphyrinogen III oxidase [Arthrobacter sp. D2]OEH64478.1 coproporphyrinogen III oxidase [Arthrobacter sp. D4]QOI63151.1 coproporphyrinogen III ox
MPSVLPLGDPAPADGLLPSQVLADVGRRKFGLYVHIPFCAVRCGYCDFNTYTATELGGGASQAAYSGTAASEVDFAAKVLEDSGLPRRPMSTVFFGGGTPTLLPAEDLAEILRTAVGHWGLEEGAEVTTEANPDSVTRESLQVLKDAGFTRVSFGMQSAVPHVLKVLDRTHTPSRVPQVVQWAREAGLAVSLDLIYGTPGESMADWRESLETALSYEPDHISAYALIVEEGTKLAAQIRRGEVPGIDDDDHAAKYELADQLISEAGLGWYEVSNWARTPEQACRHNLAYWRGDDWWGIGPGAHSHVGGVRWWNVKHPAAYASRLVAGESPAAGRETLDAGTRDVERIMLEARLVSGLAIDGLDKDGRRAVAGLIADGLAEPAAAFQGRLVLTLKGRLLADAVVRRILPD